MAAHSTTTLALVVLNLLAHTCFAGPKTETYPGTCRLVCDPYQAQGASHSLGINGIVIPLSSGGGGAGGPPGPAGPPGKAGPPGPCGLPGSASSLGGKPVAFHAALTQEFNRDAILKFTDVVTNVGGAYDSSTGKFTSPDAGVYHFSFNILKAGQRLRVELVSGSKVVATGVALDMLHTDSASGSAVVQLAKGDQVFLRLTGSDKTMVDSSSRFSTFTGYLIHAL